MQNYLEHSMHRQENLVSPYIEIMELMKPEN